MRLRFAPFFPLLAILIPLASAVFADEAYQIDYQHVLFGSPQRHTTFFHRPSAASKASLLYTLSEKLVLGAVNPKDGAVIWRQWLKNNVRDGNGKGFLKSVDGEDVVVSAVDERVRAWDASHGKLVWEWIANEVVRGLEVLDIEGKRGDVIASTERDGKSFVTRLAASSGEVVWQYIDESGDLPAAVSASSTQIYYISLHSALLTGYKTKVTTLDIVTGKSTGQVILSTDSEVTSVVSILYISSGTATPLMVWTDTAFKSLRINVLGTKHITTFSVANKDKDEIQNITVHAPRTTNAQPHFLVQYQTSVSHWAEVYHIDIARGTAKLAYELPKLGGKGAFSTSTVDANVYFTRNTDFEVTLVSSASHGVLGRWSVRPKSHSGLADPEGVKHAVSEVVAKDGSNFAVRSALVLASGDWELVRNGDPVWIRPESLAGVVAVAFVDIPAEADLAKELAVESHDNILAAYIHRVRRHVRDLKHFPTWLQGISVRVIGSFLGDKAETQDKALRRDGFGFRKIVILATEKGRVVALDAGMQGDFLWSVQMVEIPEGSVWNVTNIEINGDRVVFVAAQGEPVSVETLTGQRKPYTPGLEKTAEESFIHVSSTTGAQSLITVYADGTPKTIPPNSLGNAATLVTRHLSGSIRGWALSNTLEPMLAWEFSAPPGELISSIATRPTHDPVASIGKALGDRNVLYKYLSPNLIIVSTTNALACSATIHLLDTITGRILYTTTHTGISTIHPIPLTFSENWFAYSLFSDPSHPSSNTTTFPQPKAHQLIFTELYESPFPNDRGPLGSAANFSSLADLPLPHAISAA